VRARQRLGRDFGWLWAAYAVSTTGTWLGFGAFPLIAILVLHSGAVAVSALAAVGLAAGALAAVPLGPWVELRRKRPVMVGMDLVRFAALLSVPIAYALGGLSFVQLMLVSIVVAAANIAFTAASGAYLKSLVQPADLLVANARFESTTWTATAIGPPLGGLAIGVLGPVTTVLADAASYLLSALGIRAIGGDDPAPAHDRTRSPSRLDTGDLLAGWRFLIGHRQLRRLRANTATVNGLIMVSVPLTSVLMLRQLGDAPWQYGLAFGLPCVGGLVGSRLARPMVLRYGQRTLLRTFGILRVCWSVGLAFIPSGAAGVLLVIAVQLGIVTCSGIFNPVLATYRLEQIPRHLVARVLAAWSITSNLTIAAMTVLWGVLAALTTTRFALGAAGVLMLATALLLPLRADAPAIDVSDAPASPADGRPEPALAPR
jgi:MFS family permease